MFFLSFSFSIYIECWNWTGSGGFVAINNADSSWTATFTTSLPAGTYCDVISGSKTVTGCSGNTCVVFVRLLPTIHSLYLHIQSSPYSRITVSSTGTFSVTISNRNAVAIHTGAATSLSPITSLPSSSSSGSLTSSSTSATPSATSVPVTFQETATTTFGEVSCYDINYLMHSSRSWGVVIEYLPCWEYLPVGYLGTSVFGKSANSNSNEKKT